MEASLTLREGREAYFAASGIPADGGYTDNWVVIKIAGVPVFAFKNTSPVAVFLNCQVFGSMLVFHPRRMYRAFMRSRRAANLYGTSCDDELLSRSVGEMREELRVDAPVGEPTREDRRAFWRWSARALIGSWGPGIPIIALVWWIWV